MQNKVCIYIYNFIIYKILTKAFDLYKQNTNSLLFLQCLHVSIPHHRIEFNEYPKAQSSLVLLESHNDYNGNNCLSVLMILRTHLLHFKIEKNLSSNVT